MTSSANPSSASPDIVPALGVLDRAQCEAILHRNVVGRLGFTLHDRVNITPVHFAYEEGCIYARTKPAGKLLPILRNRRVAFEVDEYEDLFNWNSVIVHGPLYLIEPESNEHGDVAYSTALRLLRQIVPSTLADGDPVPFRNQLFRIQVSEISGRFSEHGGTPIPAWEPLIRDEGATPEADAALRASALQAVSRVLPSAASQVHVDAFDGVVVLTGVVEGPSDRTALERELLRAGNVRAVVQQLETAFPEHRRPEPPEIARAAIRQLDAGSPLTGTDVKIVIEHQWVRAEGTAASSTQRDEVIRRLRNVSGSRGVIDRVHLLDRCRVSTG
jgi:nitroimidazol reductase NimA-like FMN-containing flavoprotein (pyridoxamine 5'-phosphate oxidase superfamily)/osmotically-inducible protein OsmY